jgi:hypothetical protein
MKVHSEYLAQQSEFFNRMFDVCASEDGSQKKGTVNEGTEAHPLVFQVTEEELKDVLDWLYR